MANPCPIPPYVKQCLPIQTYNVGGTSYMALELCDNAGKFLAVYQICNGVISGTPEYFTLDGASYIPSGTPHDCSIGDFEQNVFCDTATDPPTPFISRIRWDENGDLIPEQTGTFSLDGITPFTPVGPVTVCGGDVVDTEIVGPVCEKDPSGNTIGQIWHKIFYRGTTQLATVLTGFKMSAPNAWLDPYTLDAGNTMAECSPGSTIKIVCACDDADGDSVGEVSYKKIISISNSGVVTLLSTYNRAMTAVYTPVSPVDCSVPGDNLIAARARYKVQSGVGTWVLNADSVMPTTSVGFTVVAIGNTLTPPTITDFGGTYPMFAGQSINWSIINARDVAGLRSPLVLTTGAGDTVIVSWTEELT